MITLLICSVTMSVIALLYMAAAPFLAKRYSEPGRYYAWLIIVVGLIIPFRPEWGNAIVSVELPASTPPPFVQASGEMPGHFYRPRLSAQNNNQQVSVKPQLLRHLGAKTC
jgi:hypothetical protein